MDLSAGADPRLNDFISCKPKIHFYLEFSITLEASSIEHGVEETIGEGYTFFNFLKGKKLFTICQHCILMAK